MKVGTDGKLFSRQGSMIKTMPSLARVALVSSLPDATLMGLEEIVITSSTGFTLQIKVHGFSRIPVLNSRCGNVVHFYTAWKGRVTLDSTDLSFDDDTAAAFTKAGFDLAVGGRRLSGESSINGFFKSIDELKSSGKWTCADVPLPTLPETGVQRRTMYSLCIDGCKSKHGGTVYGTSLLPQGDGFKHQGVYMKTFSTVLESNTWTVQVDRYQQHPGQQLVWISDKRTHRVMKFQVQDKEAGVSHRTHCHVATDASAAFDAARKDPKVDSNLHFQYLGVVEEHGKVMRHFRAWYSDEFENIAFGTSQEWADYWDDANNLRPMRLMTGGEVVVFDSVDAVSDSDVETKVQKLGGFGCKDFEGETELEATIVPRMNKFKDLSLSDVVYYIGDGSVVHSADFVSYLSSVQDPLSVSDKCFDRCRREMDNLRSSKEMCDGSLASAMSCMQGGESECVRSDFVNDHANDCQSNITEDSRGLELQEAADEHELLTNESLSARNLLLPNLGSSLCSSNDFIPKSIPSEKHSGACSQVQFGIHKGKIVQNWMMQKGLCKNCATFKLRFTWARKRVARGVARSQFGLAIFVQGSAPFDLIFGKDPLLTPIAKTTLGTGGEIKCFWKRSCPHVSVTMKGRVFFELKVEISRRSLSKLRRERKKWNLLEGKNGCKQLKGTPDFNECQKNTDSFLGEGAVFICGYPSIEGKRRRRHTRRRVHPKCYIETCDLYVKGQLQGISSLQDAFQFEMNFEYWTATGNLIWNMQIDHWRPSSQWSEKFAFEIFDDLALSSTV